MKNETDKQNAAAPAASSAQEAVAVDVRVLRWLLGESEHPETGLWFERPEGRQGSFWWRKELRAAMGDTQFVYNKQTRAIDVAAPAAAPMTEEMAVPYRFTVREALQRLVDLKEMKRRIERGSLGDSTYYEANKEQAWTDAEQALGRSISPAPVPASELVLKAPLTYLAAPYSHPDRAVRVARFDAINKVAAKLMSEGALLYSPISHTHPIAEAGSLPLGWDFWHTYDKAFIYHSRKVVVLMLDGWQQSKGVTAEIAIATDAGIPIEYMEAAAAIECRGEAATKDDWHAFRETWRPFQEAYRKACDTSHPHDWCSAAGAAQQIYWKLNATYNRSPIVSEQPDAHPAHVEGGK